MNKQYRVMKSGIILLITAMICTWLTGCTAMWSVQDAGPGFDHRNLARPKSLLPGQKALVYGKGYYVETLRNTGLFASVEPTSNRQPQPTGVYISFEQVDSYQSSDDSGLFGTLINIASLGVIPDPAVRAYHVTYTISVYQNGAPLIKEASAQVQQNVMAGWFALAVDEQKTWRNESELLVQRMISELNAVR